MEKLYVVKIGGNVIDDPDSLNTFLSDFAQIPSPKILVHGGGKMASGLAKRMGVSQAMVNGRRITDQETLKIAVMVYSGQLNKQIVSGLQARNVNALGLSGADLNLIRAKKRLVTDIDYGFAGDLAHDSVNVAVLQTLLNTAVVPVFSAITHDGKGQLLNTNADTIASAIAAAMSGSFDVQLNYCFEKRGVLLDPADDSSVIVKMNKTKYSELSREGIISKGMIPKLENAFDAIGKGVGKVIIGHSGELINMMEDEFTGTSLVG
ncbi:MAG: acetylglutamate kinase [Bacteroidia bacterium]